MMKASFLSDMVKSVLHGMRTTKLRTALAVVGVAFGAAAVTAVLSIGQGGEARVRMELNAIGINRAWMYPDKEATRGFRLEDAQWLSSHLGDTLVMASSQCNADVSNGPSRATAQAVGCEWQLPGMESTEFVSGRFFTSWEEENARPCVVLDVVLAEKLFGERSPVGSKILVNGRQGSVIGVVSKRSMLAEEGTLYLPITTYNNWFAQSSVDQISIAASSTSALRSMKLKAGKLLEARTGSVKVVTLEGETKIADNVLGTFRTVILCVAAVALLVGGIGIMNMMYMSVNERVREIGLRKAIGAKRKQILLQFLMEAILLAVAGGLLGILCGVLLSYGASALASVPFIIPAYAPFIGVGFSAVVGVLFGLSPAQRAARLNPVEALRSDN